MSDTTNDGINFDDAGDLAQAVQQAVGAASVCWENPGGAGIFDSDRALHVASALISWIYARYVPVKDRAVLEIDQARAWYESTQQPVAEQAPAPEFRTELSSLINRHSKENESDTPDFILAQFLCGALANFDATVRRRDEWYGHKTLSDKLNLTTAADDKGPRLGDIFR